MKRIFIIILALCNFTLCNAQDQTSFIQKLFQGLYSIFTTETSASHTGGILTQEMIDQSNGSIRLSGAYDLEGRSLSLPQGFKIIFDGGSLSNGILIGNESSVEAALDEVFSEDISIEGTWNQPEIRDAWFSLNDSTGHIANNVIKNILALANDNVQNKINFTTGRTYYFEMPYKGRPDLGNLVYTYKDKDGKKRWRYSDLMKDDYDYLRIFTIPSNTSIILNSNLEMLPTNQGAYFVFWEYDKKNISIEGTGTVKGDVEKHLYTTPFAGKYYYGEYGHLFIFQKCHNVSIKGITVDGAFGDGIIFRGSFVPTEKGERWGSDLTVDRVTIRKARRNGITIAARNVRITNCHFEECGSDKIKGTAPRSAIDFEADKITTYKEIGNQNVMMDNCTFKGNRFDISSYHNNLNEYGKNATTVSNCNFTSPLMLNTTFWMTFKNCTFTSFHDPNSTKSQFLYCRHMIFDNCEFKKIEASVIKNAKNASNTFRNCKY